MTGGGIDLDVSELRTLASDLGKVPGRVVPEVDAVLKRGAANLKDEYNEQFARSLHFKGAAGSVSFDSVAGVGHVGYEVGPDKDRRGGALGNLFFFGGANGGGGTGDLEGPLDVEAASIEKHIGKALGRLL